MFVKIKISLLPLLFVTAMASCQNYEKPNVIIILADDLGYTDINSFDPLNRNFYETPNIDQLAAQGIKFTNAYANAANCSPSRAAIMSGQYYPRQPIYHVGKPKEGILLPAPNATELPLEKITLAESLKKGGYETGFIGKWHLGTPPETGPEQQGFDINVGGYHAGNPADWEGGYFHPNNNPFISDAREGEYLTDFLTRKAVEYIHEKQNKPFYLQLSYYTPHSPFQAPEDLVRKYESKEGVGGHDNPTYAAMLEKLDNGVGTLMATLEELGIADNTIVIFFSDNGGRGGYGFLGRGNTDITDNSPLKGGKTTFYEGGIRVPLIIRWPDMISAGTTSEENVIGTDFYPTLLDATRIEKAEDYILDGVSLVPILKDPDTVLEPRFLYWHFPGYPNSAWRTSPVSVIHKGPWKLMKFYEGQVELYNLEVDPGEEHNLAEEKPEVRKRLQEQLESWLTQNNAPMPRERK